LGKIKIKKIKCRVVLKNRKVGFRKGKHKKIERLEKMKEEKMRRFEKVGLKKVRGVVCLF